MENINEKEIVEMTPEEERAYVIKIRVEDHWKKMEILRRISLCPTCKHCESIDINGNVKCRLKYGVEKAKTYCIDYEYSQEAESRWKKAEKQC